MDAEKFMQIPGHALNVSSRLELSCSLDPEHPLCSEDGLPLDYRGLACLMKFEHIKVRNFERTGKPTMSVLEEWEKRTDATIGQLLNFLKQMGRYDVIQDVFPLIEKDTEAFLKKQSRSQEIPLQVPEVTSCQRNDIQVRNDANALTCDDVRTGECTYYDAYLCYADENEDVAFELAKILELELGFKLFIHSRDSLSGQEEVISNIQLIKDRCRRMLIILSPEFPRSPACEFQIGFASSLAIEQRERILLPILLAPVNPSEIPLVIRFISKIDFTKQDIQKWAWERLIYSLGTASQQHNINYSALKSRLEKNPFWALNTGSENGISAPGRPSIEFLSSQSLITNTSSTSAIPSIEFPPSQSDIAVLNDNESARFQANVSVSHKDPPTATTNDSNVCVSHENKSHINPTHIAKTAESSSLHTKNKISKPSSFERLRNIFKGKKNFLKPPTHPIGQLSSGSVSSTSNATSGFFSHNTFDNQSIEGLSKSCS